MRPKTLAILAIVVGALLGLIYFAEDKVASTDERAAAAKRLVNVEPDAVVSLAIDWQGARVRFERDAPAPAATGKSGESAEAPENAAARSWRIVEPLAQRADDAAVSRLLTTLTALEAVRDLEGAVREAVGLEPPRGTVSWRTADGEGRLEIGGAVPASHDVVVAASGRGAPAVAGDGFLAELSRPAGDWRAREVVTAGRERIERVELSGTGSAAIGLARTGDTLRLASPVVDVADRELTESLLTELANLRMETFLDAPLTPDAEKALAEPAGSVEVTVAGESVPVRIEVGGLTPSGKRVWRAGDQVFESASALAGLVGRPADAWRSRSWTRFENWRIEKARVEAADGSFELVRSGGEWLRDGKKIPFTAASDLLYALTSARAERLVAESPAASTALPRLTVTLSDADGNEERLTLLATADADPAVPASTAGRDVTLLLPRSLVADLEAKLAGVRNAAPLEAPGDAPQPAPGDPGTAAPDPARPVTSSPS